jgi:uncharacterized BrkB/YihY/UPF0761 family membrane protein
VVRRIYEIEEGRPVWKLRPLQLVLTLGTLVAAAAAAFMLAVSGPVATAVGDTIGAGEVTLTVWNIAQWPLILAGHRVLFATAAEWVARLAEAHHAGRADTCLCN